jgi:predicted kinase
MAIVFMAGFPYAGKTYIVDKILRNYGDDRDATSLWLKVISPKLYRPDDYERLSESERREIDLAAWECSLEDLEANILLAGMTNDVIIYDTACASLSSMLEYFKLAKSRGHVILYVFVNCPLKICKQRANGKLSNQIFDKYVQHFKDSIPRLSKMSDKAIVINNMEGEPNIRKVLKEINAYRVCESQ